MHESGLRLELTEPGEQVHARYTPEPGRLAPDHASLKQCLDRHGWAGARLDAHAVARFLQQCQRTGHSGNVAFDGTLRVAGDIRTGMSVRVP